MELLSDPQVWTAFLTLTVLEIVLGIDNIVFISILTDRLPASQRDRARVIGLGAAMIMRILLLFAISWIIGLTEPWFEIFGREFSGRDIIMLAGGFFLLYKATTEIHAKLEGEEHHQEGGATASFAGVIAQIMALDIVFSLDSVITAVGMADDIEVMIAAVVVAVGVMLWASGPLATFVQEHPTVKILALSFLILIGFSLVAEGFHQHIPKGYIYTAMAFSVIVEVINLRVRSQETKPEPVHLKQSFAGERAVERAGQRGPAAD
ncbi:MAG TPA: TerC family protein [Thermomicrobiales bacterium]|jgi:predicted tellurium resistance membrane protein TerC|nr:TerC family protein [Thermomicrobiales bacterium]